MRDLRLFVVSGLSGSGKTCALKCFEDMGFFCVDNLPPPLLPKFAELCAQSSQGIRRVALGVDIREREFLDQFLKIYDHLKGTDYPMEILFLEARDEIIVRRFSETRRPHPLAHDRPVLEGIRLEQKRLKDLKKRADHILDTSDYSVHQLKEVIAGLYAPENSKRRLQVTLLSFGFKYGVPYELDLLFDVRFLPNPNFVPQLRTLTGQDAQVSQYVVQSPQGGEFLKRLFDLLDFLLLLYEKEGRSYLTIGIGCTGGQHRSVALVEHLKNFVRGKGYNPTVRHRDVQPAR